VLGEHKLLCGDARSADDLARLMGGGRADVAFLDPPRGTALPQFAAATAAPPAVDFVSFLTSAFAVAAAATHEGGVHFVSTDWQHVAAVIAAANSVYGNPVDGAIWVKSEARSGAPYCGRHEFIAVFAVGNAQRRDLEGRRKSRRLRSAIWHYPEMTWPRGFEDLRSQPRGKPVALIADAINDATRRGDIVLDIFATIGTTILAAERVKLHARAVEAEPRLVDIAVRRWQAATRANAVHAESGLSFDEVAARGRRSEAAHSPLTHQGGRP
jgi:hypothetical protein